MVGFDKVSGQYVLFTTTVTTILFLWCETIILIKVIRVVVKQQSIVVNCLSADCLVYT